MNGWHWKPIDSAPDINDHSWWYARHPTLGACRARWMPHEAAMLEAHPSSGKPLYRHAPGNRDGHPTVQETFTGWMRELRD